MTLNHYLIYICSLGFLLSACNKAVEIAPPSNQLVGQSVYSSNALAVSAVTGIYGNMFANSVGGGVRGISGLAGLSADEFILYPNPADQLLGFTYTNSLTKFSDLTLWSDLYARVYQANSAIEGIFLSTGVTESMKKQLIGESEFVRAFCFFYLTNFYGDVPLVTTTDYKKNEQIARSPQEDVYRQIVEDLTDAQTRLSYDFLDPSGAITNERVRPNKGAVTALLARVYLYKSNYDSAAIEATQVINDSRYNLCNDLDSVFLANNNETIWQLEAPVASGYNTADGFLFLLSFSGGPNSYSNPYILSDSLIDGFETSDIRRLHWTDSTVVDGVTYYFPYKYKLTSNNNQTPVEFPVILRLAEQYLIRAEARTRLGDFAGAQEDLNIIRNRAGLPNTTASIQQDLLDAILKERRFELFTEYGHRWFDLKRTGSIDALMSNVTPLKGGEWKTTSQLYPIPDGEIKLDNKLTQNPGY